MSAIKKRAYNIWVLLKKIQRFLRNFFIFIRWRIKFAVNGILNPIFNATVKAQNKDYKSIPIIIISFNQLEYLKKLITFLNKYDYYNIIILDNNSTYPPLLDYLNKIEDSVKIHRFKTNYGHRVFWKRKEIYNEYAKGYYVVTDPDVVPVSECPHDFLEYFKSILDANAEINKVGFSLRIDDIPDTNIEKEIILKWESQFWGKLTKNENYLAKIDTTFALYKPKTVSPMSLDFFHAIRVKYPYTAKHGGWYIDSRNLNAEQKYYIKTVNKSSSWLNFNSDGKIAHKKI